MARPLHKEDIKAGLRKLNRSLVAFEAKAKLPAGSVKDVLRGRSSATTEVAIAKELNQPLHLLFPKRYPTPGEGESSTFVDNTPSGTLTHRLSGGGSLDMAEPLLSVIEGGAPAVMAPAVSGQILDIPLALIDVGERLRPVDPSWAAAVGRVMTVEGQRTAIEVCRLPGRTTYLLVTGAHRLEGARIEGYETVRAVVVSADALDRRSAEISENLWRKGLSPLDRAAFVSDLNDVLRARAGVLATAAPQAIAANARWQKGLKIEAEDACGIVTHAYGFAEQLGSQIGLSRETIYNDLALHRRLLPDIAAQLRAHDIGRNAAQLRALAKLPDADQRKVAGLLVAGTAKSVSAALAQINGRRAPDPETKRLSAFVGAFERMGAAERKAALRTLPLPKGWTLSEGGQ